MFLLGCLLLFGGLFIWLFGFVILLLLLYCDLINCWCGMLFWVWIVSVFALILVL